MYPPVVSIFWMLFVYSTHKKKSYKDRKSFFRTLIYCTNYTILYKHKRYWIKKAVFLYRFISDVAAAVVCSVSVSESFSWFWFIWSMILAINTTNVQWKAYDRFRFVLFSAFSLYLVHNEKFYFIACGYIQAKYRHTHTQSERVRKIVFVYGMTK